MEFSDTGCAGPFDTSSYKNNTLFAKARYDVDGKAEIIKSFLT